MQPGIEKKCFSFKRMPSFCCSKEWPFWWPCFFLFLIWEILPDGCLQYILKNVVVKMFYWWWPFFCHTELEIWKFNSCQWRIAHSSAHKVMQVSNYLLLSIRALQPASLGIEKLVLSRVFQPEPFYNHLKDNSSDKICYLFWRKHVLKHQNCFIIWKYI